MSRRSVVGLVDIRSMYVSCERAFQPELVGRPVVVLSNNDGCVVARSSEAKTLEVGMGQPWYQIVRHPRWSQVIPRSSNYELYGDMASRFVQTLSTLVADVEVYSIDETFVTLPAGRADQLAHEVQERVRQWLGLPVAIGLGRTKTLAKIAQHHAKRGLGSGEVLDTSTWPRARLDELLHATSVHEVWGVGHQLAKQLTSAGIWSARDLAHADPGWVRRRWNVVLERTARELAGVRCIPVGGEPPVRQQVMYSRMFGMPVTDPAEMRQVLTQYAGRAAHRLRAHGLEASLVTTTASTSEFRERSWSHARSTALETPTSEPAAIITAAHTIVDELIEGRPYNRAGILLTGLVPAGSTPQLGPDPARPVGPAIDQITARWGRHTIGHGHAGLRGRRGWDMRRDHLSPAYTTRWEQMLTATASLLLSDG